MPFFEQVIYLFFFHLKDTDVCPAGAKYAHILVFHRIPMDIFHPIELSKKISSSNSLMVSRDKQNLLVSFLKRPDYVVSRPFPKCKIAAKNHKVDFLFQCLLSKLLSKADISMYVSSRKYLQFITFMRLEA